MAKRYWTIGGNYGYAGTGWREAVDALKYLSLTEEELAAAHDSKIESALADEARDHMLERIEWYATPSEEQEDD